jgi:hypothetical protein
MIFISTWYLGMGFCCAVRAVGDCITTACKTYKVGNNRRQEEIRGLRTEIWVHKLSIRAFLFCRRLELGMKKSINRLVNQFN